MNYLEQLLEKLSLSEERGVLFRAKVSSWLELKNIVFTFEICERLHSINPDAIYHFNKRPYILFFDQTPTRENQESEDLRIFNEVWSWDFVPLVFIVYPDGDKVYNAFNYQKKVGQANSLEELIFKDANEKYKLFSFWELQSGNTWKWLEEKVYKKANRNLLQGKRVGQRLFDNIKYARQELERIFPYPQFINILILRIIFIRYLIDRGVKIDKIYLSGKNKIERRKSFNELIGKNDLLTNFFNYLEERFDGNLFETKNDPTIPDDILRVVQLFFSDSFKNGNNNSLFYFDVYDFSIIPIEVISGIYENVIDEEERKEGSIIYTPLFLADYILSNTVDKFLLANRTCKILDPSCGSGIFLTQTYKRLVEKEKQYGELNDEKLINIAQKNIFGIDRDINALHVAAFSIYVSILDYKEPKEINYFRLPKLIGKNLFRNDFFNIDDDVELNDGIVSHPYNRELKQQNLDFIIGNPPWGKKNNNIVDKFHLSYSKKMGSLISNYEISQSFLIRAKDFSTSTTLCSLIVSSSAFYNAKKFKEYFFKEFLVETILDLSAARRMVFQKANAPCIVVIYKFAFFKNVLENIIYHYSIKPSRFLKNYRIIVIENDDIKKIPQKYFLKYDWFFKTALYGNSLDMILMQRLFIDSQKNNIKDFIKANSLTIKYGNGILKGKPKRHFLFLEGLRLIEGKNIDHYYTQVNNENSTILTKEDTFLESGRTIELFEGIHILIKRRTKNESDLVISFIEDTVVFKNDFYAISTINEEKKLKQIYGLFISNLSTYFQFLTSSGWGVATRPEILFKEVLLMPYIDVEGKKFISSVDNFISSFKKESSFILNNQLPNPQKLESLNVINKSINFTFKISPTEEDLIDYALNISRYQFQESKLQKTIRKPTIEELKDYAEVFYNYYSTVYNEDDEYFKIEIFPLNYFTAMKFNIVSDESHSKIVIGESSTEKELFKILGLHLSIYEITKDLFVQKNIRGYEDDFFYIIKPNEYKCWHRAIAHHDLNEFKVEMFKAENDLLIEKYG